MFIFYHDINELETSPHTTLISHQNVTFYFLVPYNKCDFVTTSENAALIGDRKPKSSRVLYHQVPLFYNNKKALKEKGLSLLQGLISIRKSHYDWAVTFTSIMSSIHVLVSHLVRSSVPKRQAA